MSKLYNYFVLCWLYNANFTTTNLDNAVTKGLITAGERTDIEAMPRQVIA
ncbi:hypothetical protein [Desulfitobacterium sp. AusDCA]